MSYCCLLEPLRSTDRSGETQSCWQKAHIVITSDHQKIGMLLPRQLWFSLWNAASMAWLIKVPIPPCPSCYRPIVYEFNHPAWASLQLPVAPLQCTMSSTCGPFPTGIASLGSTWCFSSFPLGIVHGIWSFLWYRLWWALKQAEPVLQCDVNQFPANQWPECHYLKSHKCDVWHRNQRSTQWSVLKDCCSSFMLWRLCLVKWLLCRKPYCGPFSRCRQVFERILERTKWSD